MMRPGLNDTYLSEKIENLHHLEFLNMTNHLTTLPLTLTNQKNLKSVLLSGEIYKDFLEEIKKMLSEMDKQGLNLRFE